MPARSRSVSLFPFSLGSPLEFALAYFMRGKCYYYMGDFKRAIYDFAAAIQNETSAAKRQPSLGKTEGLSSFFSK